MAPAMDVAALIASLDRTSSALAALLAGLPPAAAAWKTEPGAWSIVEIAGHLLDEERDDFRPRLQSTLADPRAPWPAIDPEGAVRERGHADADLGELLAAFLEERRASLAWLRGLDDGADWDAAYEHAELGTLTAGDLLTSWAAHDVLHLRQILARLYRLVEAAGAPHGTRYAGPLT